MIIIIKVCFVILSDHLLSSFALRYSQRGFSLSYIIEPITLHKSLLLVPHCAHLPSVRHELRKAIPVFIINHPAQVIVYMSPHATPPLRGEVGIVCLESVVTSLPGQQD